MDGSSEKLVIAIAIITTLKNVADGVLAWLGRRDQLKNDSEKMEMKLKLNACEKQHEESEKDRVDMRDQIEEIKRRMEGSKVHTLMNPTTHNKRNHQRFEDFSP